MALRTDTLQLDPTTGTPASPSEGEVWFDTAAQQMLVQGSATPINLVPPALGSPVALVVGGSNVDGTGTTVARSDHRHALAAFGTVAGTICQGSDARLTNSRAPSGTASGELAGSYPSPTIAAAARPLVGNFHLVRVASTANIAALTGLLVVDGVTTAVGNRVLVKDQTTGSANGVYTVAAGAWTRSVDWATGTVAGDARVGISEGATQAHTEWYLSTQGAITVGTTTVAFAQVTSPVSGAAGGVLSGTYPNPGFNASYAAASVAPAVSAAVDSVIGTSTNYARADHAHGITYGTTALTVAQGDDSRFTDARTPTGAAGGVLSGTYPNPAFDAAYAASSATPSAVGATTGAVGTGTNYSREDHVHAVTYGTTADTAAQGNDSRFVSPSSATPAAVAAATGAVGTGSDFAREDHVHPVTFGAVANTITQGNDVRLSDARTPTGSAGGILSGTYPNPAFNAAYAAASVTPSAVAAAAGAVGTSTNYARSDHAHPVTFGTVADTIAQGNDSRFTDARTPTGTAGGVLSGSYPNPVFASAYAAASAAPTALGASTGVVGTSTNYARADHAHALTYGTVANTVTQGNDSRLSDARAPTGAAGGVLSGTYPNPTFNAAYAAASTTPTTVADTTGGAGTSTNYARADHAHAVTYGSTAGTVAQGNDSRFVSPSSATPAAVATATGAVGTGADFAREDHVHPVTFGTTINTVTQGNDSRLSDARVPTGSAGGILSGTYPNPGFNAAYAAASTTPSAVAAATGAVGTATNYARGDHTHPVTFGTTANTIAQGNDARFTDARAPSGVAGGVLSGTYPNPAFASAYAAASGTPASLGASTGAVGTGTNYARSDHAHGLTYGSTANTVTQGNDSRLSDARAPTGAAGGVLGGSYPNPTFNAAYAAATTAPQSLASAFGEVGSSTNYARADHIHGLTFGNYSGSVTEGSDARLSDARTPTGAAGGVLSGTYPNPAFNASYAASAVTPAALAATTGVVGTSTNYARGDHAHAITYGTTAATVAQGNDSRFTDARAPTGTAGGVLSGAYPNPAFASAYAAASTTPAALGSATGVVGTGTNYARSDHAHALTYGTAAGTVTQGNDSRLTDSRVPAGPAGGVLSGTYPSPSFDAAYAAASTTPAALAATTGVVGTSTNYARGDHAHAITYGTTAATVAQGNDARFTDARAPTGTAGGILSGTYPNPGFNSSYAAASTTPVALAATTGVVGTSTNYARGDHAHAITYGTTAATVAQGNDSRFTDARVPTGAAGGDLVGTYPNPTVAASARLNSGAMRLVRVTSTGDVPTRSGLLTIDGVTTVAGDRVLLKNQATASQNGIWVVAAGAWAYAPDWATGFIAGDMFVAVSEGSTQAHSDWLLITQGAITVGTTALTLIAVTVPISGAAGGVLSGTYPNPAFASAYAAASATPAALGSATGVVGTSTNYARGDHAHAITYGTTAGTVTEGDDSRLSDARAPTGFAGGGLAGTYPNPYLIASGSSGQVQYNFSSAMLGAANLDIDAAGYPNIGDVTTSYPAAPAAGVTLFSQLRAGRAALSQTSVGGRTYEFQPALWASKSLLWTAQGNSTVYMMLNTTPVYTGTATARNITFTAGQALSNSLQRLAWVSSTGAGSSCGIRHGVLQYFLSNTNDQGGFHFTVRFVIDTVKANMRWFVGMYNSAAVIANGNPSALTQMVGFGIDTGQTTVRFLSRNTGTLVSVDLGANFPATTANVTYEARLYAAPNSTTVYYSLERLDTHIVAEGNTTTTPTVNNGLAWQVWMNNGTTSGAVAIAVSTLGLDNEY